MLKAPVLKKLAKKILSASGCKFNAREVVLCITICNDRFIRKLNKDYRFKDKATDVLSFPVYEDHDQKLPILNLGDVIISIDTAKRQAIEYDVNLYQEVLRLLIHGILHLLGYDHIEKSTKYPNTLFIWL